MTTKYKRVKSRGVDLRVISARGLETRRYTLGHPCNADQTGIGGINSGTRVGFYQVSYPRSLPLLWTIWVQLLREVALYRSARVLCRSCSGG